MKNLLSASTLATTQAILSAAVLFLILHSPVNASERVALVIGNADYEETPLYNPLNDAKAISERLRAFDFDVVVALDADLATMQGAVLDFIEKIERTSTALVFYAGHGIQANGRNYLLPVDAQLKNEKSLRFEALELNDILEELEEAQARINIVILDACRNNPFERKFRGGSRGLAVVDAAQGTLIAYATAPGSVASDGDGNNGLYTQELLKALEQPGLKVEEVFKEVRRNVSFSSAGEQVPWESSSLTGDFVFNHSSNVVVSSAATQAPTPDGAQMQSPTRPESSAEILFWETVKDSASADDYRDYLAQYPQGIYASIAKRRIETGQPDVKNSCDDLSGHWSAALAGDDNPACRDSFVIEQTGEHEYDMQYAVCGAMDAVTNIKGKGTFKDDTLSFKWRSLPCSGTTEYRLNSQCDAGTGRIVKRGGLPGVCNLFVNKNVSIEVRKDS